VSPYDLPAEPRLPYVGSAGLWTTRDVLRVVRLLAVSAIALAFAWYRTAHEADWRDDGGWVVLGAAAVTLSTVAVATWLLAGLQRLAASRQLVRSCLDRRLDTAPARTETSDDLVTAAGMTRYHHAGCVLVAGKDVRVVTAQQRATLQACGMCAA
jgi:hypothetical protein